MRRLATMVVGLSVLVGCASVPRLPSTLGERAAEFGYVPLDGLAIIEFPDLRTCPPEGTVDPLRPQLPLLEILPDISVRFAVASADANGSLSFGPAKVTARGGIYRAVVDYVNVETIPVGFYLKRAIQNHVSGSGFRGMLQPLAAGDTVTGYVARIIPLLNSAADTARHNQILIDGFDEVTIPIYVGIGMRLSADVRALKGGISLTSLGGIAAEAEANALSGTLTVQTLGVTGKSIATALPLPSKLDQTTVENGILALGSSRALIYNPGSTRGDVTTTARVVGLYSPVGSDPALINSIYSELSRNKPPFWRPCGRVRP